MNCDQVSIWIFTDIILRGTQKSFTLCAVKRAARQEHRESGHSHYFSKVPIYKQGRIRPVTLGGRGDFSNSW